MRRSQISFLLSIGTTLLLLIGLLGGWLLASWQQQGRPTDRAWLLGLGVLAVGLALVLIWFQRFTQIYFFHMKTFVTDAQLILAKSGSNMIRPPHKVILSTAIDENQNAPFTRVRDSHL